MGRHPPRNNRGAEKARIVSFFRSQRKNSPPMPFLARARVYLYPCLFFLELRLRRSPQRRRRREPQRLEEPSCRRQRTSQDSVPTQLRSLAGPALLPAIPAAGALPTAPAPLPLAALAPRVLSSHNRRQVEMPKPSRNPREGAIFSHHPAKPQRFSPNEAAEARLERLPRPGTPWWRAVQMRVSAVFTGTAHVLTHRGNVCSRCVPCHGKLRSALPLRLHTE